MTKLISSYAGLCNHTFTIDDTVHFCLPNGRSAVYRVRPVGSGRNFVLTHYYGSSLTSLLTVIGPGLRRTASVHHLLAELGFTRSSPESCRVITSLVGTLEHLREVCLYVLYMLQVGYTLPYDQFKQVRDEDINPLARIGQLVRQRQRATRTAQELAVK